MKLKSSHLFVSVFAVVLGLASANSHAAKFGVRVVSPDGTPVAGAAVCIGTHGNYKQFGAMFTSANGDVTVDVPPVPLVVTISKNRFSGMRIDEPARRFNLIKTVKLHDGVPGPRCRAGSSMAQSGSGSSSSGLQINSVDVNERAFDVSVTPIVSGSANSYRISRSASMNGSTWRKMSAGAGSIRVEDKLLGSTVYLQVRRYKEVKGAVLEAQSNIFPVNLAGY